MTDREMWLQEFESAWEEYQEARKRERETKNAFREIAGELMFFLMKENADVLKKLKEN